MTGIPGTEVHRTLLRNEKGNEIFFRGHKLGESVAINIIGPTSHSENILTLLEARELQSLLNELLGPEEGTKVTTYKIVRHRFNGNSRTTKRGLTLEEAQAHCQREDTHGPGWFDGYDEEK